MARPRQGRHAAAMVSISFLPWPLGEFLDFLCAEDDAEVAGGPGIGAAEGEEQVDFRAPGADAWQRRQGGAHCIVVTAAQPVEIEPLLDERGGQGASVSGLLAAESDRA